MKYHTLKFILLYLSFSLFQSCTKVLDYDIPDDEKKIVVNCMFHTGAPFETHINKSLHILDRIGIKPIDNATIQLYSNDQLVAEMNQGLKGLYLSEFIPQQENEYLIVVSVPGLNTARATCTVPVPVEIEGVDTVLKIYNYASYDYYSIYPDLQCEVRFIDPPGEENFYELRAYQNYQDNSPTYSGFDTVPIPNSVWIASSLTIKSKDPVIEQWITGQSFANYADNEGYLYAESVIFSDRLFPGVEHRLKISMSPWFLTSPSEFIDSASVNIQLRSVTRDYYLYMQLLEKHLNVKDDPFSEPVQAYSNVQNGLGIFTGYSQSVFKIEINK